MDCVDIRIRVVVAGNRRRSPDMCEVGGSSAISNTRPREDDFVVTLADVHQHGYSRRRRLRDRVVENIRPNRLTDASWISEHLSSLHGPMTRLTLSRHRGVRGTAERNK